MSTELRGGTVRRRLAALVVAIVVGLSAGVLVAPTSALAAWSSCPSLAVCLWNDGNGQGTVMYQWSAGPGTCHNIASASNDRASSYMNKLAGTRHMQLYSNANCTGHALHKTNLFGGATQPFPSVNSGSTNSYGNFYWADNQHLPGCDHCDDNVATSIFFNTA